MRDLTQTLLHSLLTAFVLALTACASLPTAPADRASDTHKTTSAEVGQNPTSEQASTSDSDAEQPKGTAPDTPTVTDVEKTTPVPLDARWQGLLEGELDPLIAAVDGADETTLLQVQRAAEKPTAKQVIALRLALLALHRSEAVELPTEVPDSLRPLLEQTTNLRAALGQARPGRIGLLLPQDRPWGEVLEKAFRFGLADTEIDVVAASSEDPEAGMRQLIVDEGVALVVCGPFLKRARRAAVVAQRFGVPMISLAREQGLADLGGAIFQVGLTNEAQIDRLVAGAMEQRNYQRFAVIFPRTASGWQALARFTAQVEARGGQVTKTQPYLRGETTFTPIITGMVGRDAASLQSNPKYRTCVAAIPEHLKGLRKKRQVESCRDHTPPKVDFDAIFIPDSVATVRQIMPFIELADMVPNLNDRVLWRTRKATENEELIATPILGMRQLNSHYFATRSRTDVEGSLFVDTYYPYDKARALPGDFTRAFRKAFTRPPDLLETLAYDVGLLVAHLAESERLSSRAMALSALRDLKDFEAVTGPWTMSKQGQVERPIYLLSIHNRRILTESDRVDALQKKKKKKRRRGR